MSCKIHDTHEPQEWDYEKEGMWFCPECSPRLLSAMELERIVDKIKHAEEYGEYKQLKKDYGEFESEEQFWKNLKQRVNETLKDIPF